MKSNENTQEQAKKTAKWKIILAMVVVMLLIISGFVYSLHKYEPQPDPTSEKLIRKAAATQLRKDPNELTDEDFAQITKLNIGKVQQILSQNNQPVLIGNTSDELTDIRLLGKFTNLKELYLGAITVSEKRFPKWIIFMAKLKLIDLNKRYAIDLSPLKNMKHLEYLQLGGPAVRNLEPLAGTNLKSLSLMDSSISDISPLKRITQLQALEITYCPNIKKEDLDELRKVFPNLILCGTLSLNK